MGDLKMSEQTEKRSGVDRRKGDDRRHSRQLNLTGTYFVENRKSDSDGRRVPGERREGYTLISKWHGAMIGIEA
jgi:hypothetical protein